MCHDAAVTDAALSTDPFRAVVGQEQVVAHLRACADHPVHAYLVTGPIGAGARDLARGFAAAVVSANLSGPDAERAVSLVLADHHPDVTTVGAEGSKVRKDEAQVLVEASVRAPVEGDRKVLVGLGFDVITSEAAARLLKSIEEPPPSAVFVLLAEDVPPELVTIASRCVRIEVPPLPSEVIAEQLGRELDGEVSTERVEAAALAAGGDLERARLLAVDERLAVRRAAWLAVPDQLDGTGATAHRLVDELLAMVDEVVEPLRQLQAAELAEAEAQAETYGGMAKGDLKRFEEGAKRQQRRVRTQELRFGLALLAARYRDALITSDRPGPLVAALDVIGELAVMVAHHNPNERLQLQALLWRLPALGGA